MRINRFIASATGMSRRAADKAIEAGEVSVNGERPSLGQEVSESDEVTFHPNSTNPIRLSGSSKLSHHTVILLNKPAGYVCSRNGQGNKTVYDLLPPELHKLKPVGRLDKDSSGLLLLTDDGDLANRLTHPKFRKEKVYEVELEKPLTPADKEAIERGVKLEDGTSKLSIRNRETGASIPVYEVSMSEGRNRQIRRSFAALGYKVVMLHRTRFGEYRLENLVRGSFVSVSATKTSA